MTVTVAPAKREPSFYAVIVAEPEETATVAPRSVADAPRADDEEVPAE